MRIPKIVMDNEDEFEPKRAYYRCYYQQGMPYYAFKQFKYRMISEVSGQRDFVRGPALICTWGCRLTNYDTCCSIRVTCPVLCGGHNTSKIVRPHC